MIDQRGSHRLAIAASQAPRLLHAFGMHANHSPNSLALRRHTRITQLAGPSALASPRRRRLALSIGGGDMDVATEADNVAEAEPVEKGKQLLIAEAAIGQNGDATARRQQFRQALHAAVLVGTALVLELVLPDAQPEQRRRPAMAGPHMV